MGSHGPRELDTDERAVLDRLLATDFPGVGELRRQATDVRVVGRCDCGCPSIYLDPIHHRPAPISDGLVPSELRVTAIAGEPEGDVILFVKDGRLSYLEYVHYTDTPPASWPKHDRLRSFPRQ
jgi:hypothetical protein